MLLLILGLDKKQAKNGRIMFNGLLGKGFVALREHKRRYGRTKSPCFTQYHFGLTSLYFQRKRPNRYLGNSFGF